MWDKALLAATQILFAFSPPLRPRLFYLNQIVRIIFEVVIYFLSADKKREKRIWAAEVWRDASMWTFERFQHLIETRIRALERSPNWERWKWRSEGTSLKWTERLRESCTLAVCISDWNIKDYHMLRCNLTTRKHHRCQLIFLCQKTHNISSDAYCVICLTQDT